MVQMKIKNNNLGIGYDLWTLVDKVILIIEAGNDIGDLSNLKLILLKWH